MEQTINGAASAASNNSAIVNFGGKVLPGREYVYSLTDIVLTAGVIEYPESLRGKNKTVGSLTPEEKIVFDQAPFVPMTRTDKSPVVGKDGKPVMKAKAVDTIQFVMTNDEVGSKTGPFDFLFKCWNGDGSFRPQKDFAAFLLTTKNVDVATLTGNKSLWDIYKKGDKFVVTIKPELRNGKYTQIDGSKIKPYAEGMVLTKTASTEEAGVSNVEMDENVLKAINGKLPLNPMDIFKLTKELGAQAEVMAAYNRLKESGKLVLVNGKIDLA